MNVAVTTRRACGPSSSACATSSATTPPGPPTLSRCAGSANGHMPDLPSSYWHFAAQRRPQPIAGTVFVEVLGPPGPSRLSPRHLGLPPAPCHVSVRQVSSRPHTVAGRGPFPGSLRDMRATARQHDPGGASQSIRGRQQRHGVASGRLVTRPRRGSATARRRDHSIGARPWWRMDDRVRWAGPIRHAAVAGVPHRSPYCAWPPGWSG